MKRFFLLVAAMAIMLPGCKKINEELDALGSRLDKLEQETIPSIDEQIAAINVSLDNLNAMDKELKGYIDGLTATATNLQEQINNTNTKIDEVKAELKGDISSTETVLKGEIETAKANVIAQLEAVKEELENELAQINATIATLQAKDTELDGKITELRTYVDTELGKTTDWVAATFATLEQYNELVSEVATIKEQIKAINESITNLETKLTTKINEDIATAVSTLNADIQQKVKDITEAYTAAVKTAKEEITAAYTTAIQTAINALDASLKAWVGEALSNYYTIAEVEAKITALQTAITEGDAALQEELKSLKSQLETTAAEITAAYKKAIEEAINTNNGVIDTKIANEIASVNQRINNEVAAINAKIAEIESRLDNVEAKIAELLARIQSITYLPEYSDGVATIDYIGNLSEISLDFKISPKECAVELSKVWQTSVSCEALYTKTRAASLIAMPAIAFEVDAERGVITVIASGENLSKEFFLGTQEAKIAVVISDGNNCITSDYIPMIAKEVLDEIWYTSIDSKVIEPNTSEDWGANIISNTYKYSIGKLTFNGPINNIPIQAFKEIRTLKTITLPNDIMYIGASAFAGCHYLESITLPAYLYGIYDSAFHQCYAMTELTIPDSVIEIATTTFFNCSNLQYIYSKFSSSDNMSLVVDGVLNWVSPQYPAGDYIIPDGVKCIGNYAINYPNNVITVTIPESVESFTGTHPFIGVNNISAFYGKFVVDNRHVIKNGVLYGAATHGLIEYNIPEGVNDTGYRIFRNSTFTTVTLPASLKKIGNRLFENCDNLRTVYCKAVVPPMQSANDNIFNSCSETPIIYVPRGSVDIYKTADGWSKFADRIVGYDFE